MKRHRFALLLLLCLASSVFAGPRPYKPYDANFELDKSAAWHVETKVGNTPLIRFYTYQGTNVWDPRGYVWRFRWGESDSTTNMATLTGAVYSTYVDFPAETNDFGQEFESWYAQIIGTTGTYVYSYSEGLITVGRNPGVDAFGLLSYTYAVNGGAYGPFTGDFSSWPFSTTNNNPFLFDTQIVHSIQITNNITVSSNYAKSVAGIAAAAASNFTDSAATAASNYAAIIAGIVGAAGTSYVDTVAGGLWDDSTNQLARIDANSVTGAASTLAIANLGTGLGGVGTLATNAMPKAGGTFTGDVYWADTKLLLSAGNTNGIDLQAGRLIRLGKTLLCLDWNTLEIQGDWQIQDGGTADASIPTRGTALDLSIHTGWPGYVWTNGQVNAAAGISTQINQQASIESNVAALVVADAGVGSNVVAVGLLEGRTNVWNAWVWTTVWQTNDPNRLPLEVDAPITVTNIHGWLGGQSSTYDLFDGATMVNTGFAYVGSAKFQAVNLNYAKGALMYLQVTNGAPTNTAISIRGFYQ